MSIGTGEAAQSVATVATAVAGSDNCPSSPSQETESPTSIHRTMAALHFNTATKTVLQPFTFLGNLSFDMDEQLKAGYFSECFCIYHFGGLIDDTT